MKGVDLKLSFEYAKEEDGRILCLVHGLSGVAAYGEDKAEARKHAMSLALEVVVDLIKNEGWDTTSITFGEE